MLSKTNCNNNILSSIFHHFFKIFPFLQIPVAPVPVSFWPWSDQWRRVGVVWHSQQPGPGTSRQPGWRTGPAPRAPAHRTGCTPCHKRDVAVGQARTLDPDLSVGLRSCRLGPQIAPIKWGQHNGVYNMRSTKNSLQNGVYKLGFAKRGLQKGVYKMGSTKRGILNGVY